MKKVLFVTNIPSPYRVDFFNLLGLYCDLTVFFETNSSTERDDSWKKYQFKNFDGIILPGKMKKIDTAYCPSIIKEFKKRKYEYDIIFICNFCSLTGIKFTNFNKKKI